METGTLGDRRQVGVDALYAEAKKALSRSANELRDVTERLRETYAEAVAEWQRSQGGSVRPTEQTSELARGQQMLVRLELAVREMEGSWLFLERGQPDPAIDDAARPAAEGDPRAGGSTSVAMRILEAQEQERARLAAELHDGPAQALANAAFQVEVISNHVKHDPASAQEEIRALRARLDHELDEMRAFIGQLRPPMVEDIGLDAAIREAADALDAEKGVRVDVELDAPPALLDETQRMVVLRIAQEALRNVRKHAEARTVMVTSRVDHGGGSAGGPAWVLEVRDDGRGFGVDDALARSGRRHFGLRFMRERAQLIGARLEIVSTPQQGTTVRLTLDAGKRR